MLKMISLLSLWFLFQLFVGINCQAPTVEQRLLHTTTYVDDKLYILNGRDALNIDIIQSFFYIDVSVPFDTRQLKWEDLANVNTIPPQYGAATVKGGANNNTLFLYGGTSTEPNDKNLVYTFDPQSNTWSAPKITGNNDLRKRDLTGVIDDNGMMYLWGGESVVNGINTRFAKDMLILDTINLAWKEGSSDGAPTPRRFYAATMLPNKKILYMGGLNANGSLPLDQVYLYDTVSDSWSKQKTSGNTPAERDGFSAVLGLDGQRVIVFGGSTVFTQQALFVLDLNGFNWYMPNVTGQIPKSRFDHRADVIGNYMVVSFGYGFDESIESDIILLDISNNDNYVWTTEFIPPPKKDTDHEHENHGSQKNKSVIIGAVLGSVAGVVLLMIVGLVLWRKNKRNQKKVIPTPDNENDQNKEDLAKYKGSPHDQKEIPPTDGKEVLQTPESVITKV